MKSIQFLEGPSEIYSSNLHQAVLFRRLLVPTFRLIPMSFEFFHVHAVFTGAKVLIAEVCHVKLRVLRLLATFLHL